MNVSLPVDFSSPHALASFPADTPVLLALSGGADSRLLLELLARDADKHGYALYLAHVNHGIRGDEAVRDEQFCRTLAATYGCTLFVLHADVPALAEQRGESLELTARHVRYEYFSSLMHEHGIPLLATAHHADDNLETVLLRLTRGTSTAGLAGIAPVRPFAGGCLVRPLLQMTRADIISLCDRMELSYVTDSTNADDAFARNRIRHGVTPVLEQVAHLPQRQALRSCALLREDDELLYQLAQTALDALTCEPQALSLAALREQPLPLRRRMLLLWLRQNGVEAVEQCHLDALLHLVESNRQAYADLPKSRRIGTDGHSLRLIMPDAAHYGALPPDVQLPLTLGEQICHSGGFRTELRQIDPQGAVKQQNVYKPFIHETITFDTIDATAHWRARREGDVLLMGGIHRKIRKLQNAAHIPAALRARIPLLCDSHGVLWAPFVGTRDGFSRGDADGFCLTLEFFPDGENFDGR